MDSGIKREVQHAVHRMGAISHVVSASLFERSFSRLSEPAASPPTDGNPAIVTVAAKRPASGLQHLSRISTRDRENHEIDFRVDAFANHIRRHKRLVKN